MLKTKYIYRLQQVWYVFLFIVPIPLNWQAAPSKYTDKGNYKDINSWKGIFKEKSSSIFQRSKSSYRPDLLTLSYITLLFNISHHII